MKDDALPLAQVNAIAPGPTATPMIGSFLLGDATMPLPGRVAPSACEGVEHCCCCCAHHLPTRCSNMAGAPALPSMAPRLPALACCNLPPSAYILSAAVEAALAQSSPVKGRSCTAGDIANSALFLASSQGQAMNGQTLVVDLGLTAGVTGDTWVALGCAKLGV